MRSAAEFVPDTRSLRRLREAAETCRGCDLYKAATQTVFGAGKAHAALMLVGEQPGDAEDLEGKPFVGPAGKLLRKALAEAGIDPDVAYVTNAVKHFKFIERGKKRIHQKPRTIEVRACHPWLEAELEAVEPELVVALGATAAAALLGPDFRLTQHRGHVFESQWAPRVLATIHPSVVLRARSSQDRQREYADLVKDLSTVAALIANVI